MTATTTPRTATRRPAAARTGSAPPAGPRADPPPFRFRAGATGAAPTVGTARGGRAAGGIRFIAWTVELLGRAVDATMALTLLTVLVAIHVATWSYSFDMGPLAGCAGLSCPSSMRLWASVGAVSLGVTCYVASRVLRRLGWRATARITMLLVSFDLASVIYLAIAG